MRQVGTLGYVLMAILIMVALALPISASANGETGFLYDDLEEEQGFSTTSPWEKPALSYGFLNGTSDIAGTAEQQAVRDAMHLWHVVSNVSFTENTSNPSLAQIRVSWATGEHGHGQPFDGKANCFTEKGLVLAHAAYPEDGDVHFDDDEVWTTEPAFACEQPVDLMTVALHEVGHSLGLQHVEDPESIMYPAYLGTRRYLDVDDILGVQSLYGHSTGIYHLRDENTSGPPGITFRYGTVLGILPVIGDWDGDGDQTIGLFYPPEDEFAMLNYNGPGGADVNFHWGKSEDLPIAGDWDGDGDQTVGLFRTGTATFLLNNQNENNAAEHTFGFGNTGDVPLAGDWDGDGDDSIGVYRPSNKSFYLKNKNEEGAADTAFVYGLIPGKPIVGDWDNDGDDTIGLYDPSDGDWALRNFNSTGAAEIELVFGDAGGDNPVVGDWDGDGVTTIGLYQNG
jgi:hypothetical protein